MRRLLLVARREFLEHLRTKTFWIGILSFPVLLVLSILVPTWLSKKVDVRQYAVLDRSESEWLSKEVRARSESPDLFKALPPEQAKRFSPGQERGRYRLLALSELEATDEEHLRALVDEGRLFAFFVIGPDPVEGNEECKYVSKNLTDTSLRQWYQSLATEAVRERRIARFRLSPSQAAWLSAPLTFEERALSASGEETEAQAQDKILQWAPVAFVYILWLSVFVVAQMLLTSTIEEKSNRVMEVLLSSVTPLQLMAGKILGPAGTGLTMVGSWAVFFYLGVKLMPLLVPSVPELGLEALLANPAYMASFLIYFLLGYLLYAALLVGIGSVCNSLKEAQNLMQPIILVLIIPLLAMIPVAQDPNGTLARLLSFVPPFTPFVMMNRVAGPPALWEYAVTTLLLMVTVVFTFWGAAKIFRVGILMTGKPPRIGEILSWLRAPVGKPPARRE